MYDVTFNILIFAWWGEGEAVLDIVETGIRAWNDKFSFKI